MKKFTKILFFSLISLLLFACTGNQSNEEPEDTENLTPPPIHTPENEDEAEDQSQSDTDEDATHNEDDENERASLSDFFLPDGSKAHFKGDGNEFATLDIEVHRIGEAYVVVDENNGGALIRKLYRIEDNQIVTLAEDVIDEDASLPTEEVLDDLKGDEVYLQQPLEVGTKFGDWSIIETNATVETAYETFNNAIVLQMVDNGFVNNKYLVPDYGEVLRKSIMKNDDEEDLIITSSLESIQ